MKKIFLILIPLIFSCVDYKNQAKAIILSKNDSSVSGQIKFTKKGESILLKAKISGLGSGPVAIHIHTNGDCSAKNASSAGGHWNPTLEPHGSWGDSLFHSGDIGNINIDKNGNGYLEITDNYGRWSINGEQKTNIIGKSIIIHAGMDDQISQPSGAAGIRIGCGVIK